MYKFDWQEKTYSSDVAHLNNIFCRINNGKIKVSIYYNDGCHYNKNNHLDGKLSRKYPIYVEFGSSIFSMEWYRDSLAEVKSNVEVFITELGIAFMERL